MKTKVIIIFTVLSLFAGIFCVPQVFSDELDAKGDEQLTKAIWLYKHEDYEEAYDLLKRLWKERPQSTLVAYYLGVTCKQMQNYDEARSYLEAAVMMKPRIKNALTELIDLLYKKGELDEAKKWIKLAEDEGINPAQTSFFKGMVYLKEGEDLDTAIESFEEAKGIDGAPYQTLEYYIGLAYVKNERLKEAKKIFGDVVKEAPHSDLAGFADEYIAAIDKKEEATRPFRGNVGFALQYDDNVVLSPGSDVLVSAIGDKGDWRQVYTFNGEYNLKPWENFGAKFGYSFYLAKQFDLGFYDMTSHNFTTQPAFYLENAAISFPIYYNFVTVNDKGYLSTVSIGNLDNIKLGRNVMGQLGMFYNKDKFLWSPNGPEEDRDSDEYTGHLAWFYFFGEGKGIAYLKYALNYDDTEEDNWRYIGNKITLGATVPIMEKMRIGGTLDLFFQRFTETNFIFKQQRRDDILTLSTFLAFDIVKNVEIMLNYIHVYDSCNIKVYNYKRNVYSVGMKYKF